MTEKSGLMMAATCHRICNPVNLNINSLFVATLEPPNTLGLCMVWGDYLSELRWQSVFPET